LEGSGLDRLLPKSNIISNFYKINLYYYNIDNEIPNHSVLSKARARWGVKAFKRFFECIVWQCVETGLVDGNKLFVDSSLIDADASNNSVVDAHSLKKYLNKSYQRLEARLDELIAEKATPANSPSRPDILSLRIHDEAWLPPGPGS
jgi:hypothetical protein